MQKYIKPLIILTLVSILSLLIFMILEISKSNNVNNSIIEQENQDVTDDNSQAINWQKLNTESIQNAQSKNRLIFLHISNPSCLECQYMQYEVFNKAKIITKKCIIIY